MTNMKASLIKTLKSGMIAGGLLAALVCQTAQGEPETVDWKKDLMTVAERKRHASGKLLPLQSYDETIRRGMSFILDDHLKRFRVR
jgi:hypothetical protein